MKYAENKQRIAADIVPLLQRYIDKGGITHYVEPFFDGFCTIANIECENRLGNSNNSQIIARAETLRDGSARSAVEIRGVLLGCCDYHALHFPANAAVLIYCDMPTVRTFDKAAFWRWCRDRAADGHIIAVKARAAPAEFAPVWADIGTTAKLFINGGKQWQKYTT